jgi:2-phosphosulfolactate phosphatase
MQGRPSAVLEWGLQGVETLRDRVSVLVIVDVLSFSTAVDVAVSRGAAIFPFALGDGDPGSAAERVGAVLAVPRRAGDNQFSLSPASLKALPPGTRLMLPSPNGSRLSLACGATPTLTGCLRNASAVARAAREMAGGGPVGVVPAGERWPDGSLRPAVEDLLGAGAILSQLDRACTPEARAARDAYRAAGDDIPAMVAASMSGRELQDRGYDEDVAIAVERDVSGCAPILIEGAYRAAL